MSSLWPPFAFWAGLQCATEQISTRAWRLRDVAKDRADAAEAELERITGTTTSP